MSNQRTLLYPVALRGRGLHYGDSDILVKLHPAQPDTGVIFRRVDVSPPVLIPALVSEVSSTERATTLGHGEYSIATVEHFLAALTSFGIDNALIDVDSSEMPAMDGSAAYFVRMVKTAGIRVQNRPKRFIRILREVSVEDGDKWIRLEPADTFQMRFWFDLDGKMLDTGLIEFSTNAFVQEICRARTFGFKNEIVALQDLGLIKGSSLDNAVLLDRGKIINKGGLRSNDELQNHKLLDAIGDLSLLGAGLIGCFKGYKSGHRLNRALLSKLLNEETDAWETVVFDDKGTDRSPVIYDCFPGFVD